MSKRETKQLHIDDQLRKMGRRELVEVIYALQQNEIERTKQIKKLQAQLNDRALKMTNTGSIAEASLALADIFDRAQEAADQYVQSVCESEDVAKKRADEIVEEARTTAHQLVSNAGDRANLMVSQAQAAAQAILADAQVKAARIQSEAEAMAHEILAQAESQLNEPGQSHKNTIDKSHEAAEAVDGRLSCENGLADSSQQEVADSSPTPSNVESSGSVSLAGK